MIHVFHNILWSKYKGGVFSELYQLGLATAHPVSITQIAETESDRIGLAGVDLSYHRYPYELLFAGGYGAIPRWKLIRTLFGRVWGCKRKMVLLPGFHTPEYWAMLLAARLRGKPVGVFCDSTRYDRKQTFWRGALKRVFFSQCDVFFGYGRRSHEYLRLHGANPQHIFAGCQAAALPHDYDPAQVPALRQANAAAAGAPRFLYVGRLAPEKDLGNQLRAFALVLQEMPAARLVLVGSGQQRESLVALAQQMDFAGSLEFAGAKDAPALRDEYLRATCLVLPSQSEPWGLVVNEALSYGCPVVVSNHCGCVPELVIDGVSGFAFETGNVAQLAQKMLRVAREFNDPIATASHCLAVIRPYSPEAAARKIMDGCMATRQRLGLGDA